ncbi:MAG: RdgB/HAM1 family non-canonical purine NTP pyrophosphatase [Micavibrio aeruginosavorus]|uniref:dITP/XTP pyrophosphatase n=1 Tax=Micavibrio aeruginosavorus TaxID=349221 RepID=A0A7T5R429_9BACT|nr:MAG: RdgB/HAM1 family non-canonical purine NTP pyrophosphatase [Micavibrio aeruginosavorus]
MSVARKFSGDRLIVATHNKGKIAEFAALLGDYVREFPGVGDLNLPEPEETGATFLENATIKALAAAQAAGCPALADDSGLCVNGLGGQPGVYTADWAGVPRDFVKAMRRVHDELGHNPDRSAYFISVLALAWPDGHIEHVEGRVNGTLVWPARGAGGHGYDPIFVPEGRDRTFAEMVFEEKGQISHRGRAFAALIEKCFR